MDTTLAKMCQSIVPTSVGAGCSGFHSEFGDDIGNRGSGEVMLLVRGMGGYNSSGGNGVAWLIVSVVVVIVVVTNTERRYHHRYHRHQFRHHRLA